MSCEEVMTVVRWLVSVALTLASSLIGLLVAGLVVRGMGVQARGLILGTIVLTVAQALLVPVVTKLIGRHVPTLEGGIGVVSTFLALLVAWWAPGGITFDSLSAWVLGTIVVWVVVGVSAALIGVWRRRQDSATA